MQKSFIIGLIAAILLVLFAVQNADPVTISLWIKEIESSMAVILLISFAVGALASYLLSLSAILKKNKSLRQKDEQIKNLNIALDELKARVDTVRAEEEKQKKEEEDKGKME